MFVGFRIMGAFLPLAALLVSASLAGPVKQTPKGKPPVPGTLSFNRDIRPILSENCFTCHGPDRNARKAGMRLDMRDEAVTRGVIVPGKPEKSKLIQRITVPDSSPLRMPPLAAHKQLTPAQKGTLKRWIAQGAIYEPHWAFVRLPATVALPAVKNTRWIRNPIDRFVLARLEAGKIAPSPETSRAEWLRRVTLDLTGLLPTIAETDAFLKDASPLAYEKQADRLLASPHYGERMAQDWLDIARYADSYGYQSDQLSPTWPYRDWVVRAFNSNLPYDRFLTEQIAGDLLPNATREQRLATAFNRLHRMTNEGGSVPEEWRMEGVADRVRTFGTAFLGLTIECARCHDHKYDPISQRDFYSLAAYFNSIDEYGMYDRADIVPSPSLLLPTPDQERALSDAKSVVRAAEQTVMKTRMEREEAFQAWLMARQPGASLILADQTGYFDFEAFDGAKLPNRLTGATENGARQDEVPPVSGRVGKAALLDGENNVNFPNLGRFTRHTPFTIAFWMNDPRQVTDRTVVFHASSGTDAGPHGYDLLMERGILTARLFRHWPGNAIAVQTTRPIPANAWTHVAVTYDGSSRASGLKIYVNGQAANISALRDRMVKGLGQHTLAFGQRFRDRGFKGGTIDELNIFARDLTPLEIAQLQRGPNPLNAPQSVAEDTEALRNYYFSAIDQPTREATAALSAARQKVWQAEDPQFEIAVMEEMPRPRTSYVLARGAYDAPVTDKDRAVRGTPSSLPPLSPALPRDRMGLARWLTQPDHPLTARVAVNRLWAQFFGRGLVETVEDFGIQGRLPTHPELQDWLARDFVAGGWNMKGMIKKIVLSATYRQSSALRPDLKARDPENTLLARGPSYRLSAETIRDVALFASGLMDERMGGPPVSPYQPGDLWREANTMSPAYRQSVGKDLYRRSLYTVWKRTAPMPNMVAFDAGSREVCIARRSRTNTPLQAFILLNDPQFVEAARALGERMLKEGGATDAEKVRYAFRRLCVREPSAQELTLLVTLYGEQRKVFEADKEEAYRLTRIGESKPDPDLPLPDLAAATMVAQAILNLDAAIWKR